MKATTKERRQWSRKALSEPNLGVIAKQQLEDGVIDPDNELPAFIFAGINNLGDGGFLLESDYPFKTGQHFSIMQHDFGSGQWFSHTADVIWDKAASGKTPCHHAGVHIPQKDATSPTVNEATFDVVREKINFLLGTELLEYIPTNAVWPLLNCLVPVSFKADDQIIAQGEAGDSLYIIQAGACVIKVEKNGNLYPLQRLHRGEVFGEMAILTGENRCADVYAETDVIVWKMEKAQLDRLAEAHSDIRVFLTELVTKRLENSPIIADRVIGKYLVERKLAHGGWGIVYKGVHQMLNMPVAMKMLKHKMAMDPFFQKQFIREAKIIAELNHKNIVQIYDIEERFHTIFIIQEFLEGETLQALLNRVGILSFSEAVDILVQVCKGLDYAHAKGIVHQDIKPANIFLQPDGTVKILDFGLACSQDNETTNLKGTIEYMAPEQADKDHTDQRVDIYTLGLTAFEMVLGEKPFQDEDIFLVLEKRLNEDIPDPASLRPDIPAALRRFIITACQRRPEDRYQNIAACLDDLAPLHREMFFECDGREEKRIMSTTFFFYKNEQKGAMKRLLEEFSAKAEAQGITFRTSEHVDI